MKKIQKSSRVYQFKVFSCRKYYAYTKYYDLLGGACFVFCNVFTNIQYTALTVLELKSWTDDVRIFILLSPAQCFYYPPKGRKSTLGIGGGVDIELYMAYVLSIEKKSVSFANTLLFFQTRLFMATKSFMEIHRYPNIYSDIYLQVCIPLLKVI